MNKTVFRYRSAGLLFVAFFLTVWSTFWIAGVANSLRQPTMILNDQNVSTQDQLPFLYLMMAIGVGTAAIAVAIVLYLLNARVEIEDGFIKAFNMFGAEVGRGSMSSARVVIKAGSSSPSMTIFIETDGGVIKVNKAMSNYGLFRSMIDNHHVDPPGPVADQPRVPQVPGGETEYNYRKIYQLLMILIWDGVLILIIFTFGRQEFSKPGPITLTGVIPVVVIFGLFGGVGIWMTLRWWNEKILIGEEGIVWIDYLGRRKVTASVSQIVDIQTVPEGGQSLSVFTTQGTILIQNGIKNYPSLYRNLKEIVDHNKSLGPEPVKPGFGSGRN